VVVVVVMGMGMGQLAWSGRALGEGEGGLQGVEVDEWGLWDGQPALQRLLGEQQRAGWANSRCWGDRSASDSPRQTVPVLRPGVLQNRRRPLSCSRRE
jgi:hypothetical protein